MPRFPTCFRDLAGAARALARAAAGYLIGVEDPHDEDLIEIVPCGADAAPAHCFATPVFLVHGFAHNWSAFLPLLARLEKAGFRRFVRFNYDSVGDAPEEMAGGPGGRVHGGRAAPAAPRGH